ncbi:hypothetical protein A2164_02980 [Candidatus Curtissbacteria bacterium RBG_13_35_7]|uniref:Type II secretion system protein n=1 Tax=Candidatus Curtissbacteria bacterium RBG_13_35_7 TaxID=1797705 RepID=A0A1F5G247_9BACT|nr:MAG: hypothetical protein A2164_02980 [Candidatus Curtissbacteria bacterium RBG_13_35_7]
MKKRSKQVTGFRLQGVERWGQSLIEVLISTAIAALLAVAIISTMLITQKAGTSAKNNTIATKLAQEGIEQVRIFRDRYSISALPTVDAGECSIFDNSNSSDPSTWTFSGKYSCTAIAPPQAELIVSENTNFSRRFAIQGDSSDLEKPRLVTVSIYWEESSGWKFVSSQTILSQWD